jgi:hypothetical protein
MISVPDVPGALTQVRRLDRAPAMAREFIALIHDVPKDSFDVAILPALGAEVDALLDNLAEAQHEARRAGERLSAATRQVVAVLTRQCGLTVRDAGEIMGLSFQRVSQVANLLDANDELAATLGEYGGGPFEGGTALAGIAGFAATGPAPTDSTEVLMMGRTSSSEGSWVAKRSDGSGGFQKAGRVPASKAARKR